jgi:hypothetical protein
MNHCIFHLGMPKTGTTSIQESLYYGLKDPAFHYVGFVGNVSGFHAVPTIFGSPRNPFFTNIQMGFSGHRIRLERRWLEWQLERAMRQASHRGQSLILSAESAWFMDQAGWQHFRRFMEARRFTVSVIAYLRPWKQWLESHFQQRMRAGWGPIQALPDDLIILNHKDRILKLDAVFGAENVELVKFERSSFPEGCVVQDFCRRVGIRFDPARVIRANDSLHLPALRFLYSYRRFGAGSTLGWKAMTEYRLLVQRMDELGGPPMRFHSSLVETLLDMLSPQRAWLEKRLGESWDEDIHRYDDSISIRDESDLLTYEPKDLEWLAEATGGKPSHDPRVVSAQVHWLRCHPSTKARLALWASGNWQKINHLAALIR